MATTQQFILLFSNAVFSTCVALGNATRGCTGYNTRWITLLTPSLIVIQQTKGFPKIR